MPNPNSPGGTDDATASPQSGTDVDAGKNNQPGAADDSVDESLLDALGDATNDTPDDGGDDTGGDDSPQDGDDDKGDDDKGGDEGEGKDFYKKVGNLTFKTEAEYDAWAQKNYGEVGRLTGELNKAAGKGGSNDKPQQGSDDKKSQTQQPQQNFAQTRVQMKAADFFDANPEAKQYSSVMAALIRDGKAEGKTIEDKLTDAAGKAYRAFGKEFPGAKTASTTDNSPKTRQQLAKSGGGVGTSQSWDGPNYQEEGEAKDVSDFADSAILGG